MGLGAEESVSRDMFNRLCRCGRKLSRYRETPIPEVTAKNLLAHCVAERNLRDRMVIATKFTFNTDPGNPNTAAMGERSIYLALEKSLRRLKTDYVDLYYVHAWDVVTPVEEVLSTLTDLIRNGKIRYITAFLIPRLVRGARADPCPKGRKEPITTLQLEYSLVERNIEREHIPAAQELGNRTLPVECSGQRDAHWQVQTRGNWRADRGSVGPKQATRLHKIPQKEIGAW